jgi:predicted RNA binding protein YcfA (HicA-like mRNA interferase family)
MADGFYAAVVKELMRLGYYKRGNSKGSHEKWCHDGDRPTQIVPYNLKSRHTANGILKDAGSDLHL